MIGASTKGRQCEDDPYAIVKGIRGFVFFCRIVYMYLGMMGLDGYRVLTVGMHLF